MTTVIMMNIYGQSRIFYVIARDGLLPKFMAKLHHKYDSPHITIIMFTSIFAVMAAFCPYSILAQLSSMAALLDYVVVAIIVMIFRLRLPNAERPFKCPAVFIVAPTALIASIWLLFKQIIGKDGSLLLTGEIIIYWFVVMFILYVLKVLIFSKREKV
jgi:APA family basic amino acid/polyamine antiporter